MLTAGHLFLHDTQLDCRHTADILGKMRAWVLLHQISSASPCPVRCSLSQGTSSVPWTQRCPPEGRRWQHCIAQQILLSCIPMHGLFTHQELQTCFSSSSKDT